MNHCRLILLLLNLIYVPLHAAEDDPTIELMPKSGRVEIASADRAIASYIYADPTITRPYYAHVQSLAGVRLTRSLPPVPGRDKTDHADMHPGVWLAFGDIAGADVWRNKARVAHQRFTVAPAAGNDSASFTVLNHYQQGPRLICRETARHEWRITRNGALLSLDSVFSSEADFHFGDQEEMGLGVRMASDLTVADGGRIIDSEGRRNEKVIWGNAALWCDYGRADAGILVMPHPANPAPSRWHVRDYGLMVANPFAIKAFNQGPARRTTVKAGEKCRLRFGILLRDENSKPEELKAAYEHYLSSAKS